MADVIYNAFKKYLMNGSVDLDTDTINVILVTSTYVPNQDTHAFRSDITNEVVGTGYTAGGQALASKTVTQDDIDNEGVFDAADITWTTATITARAAVLCKIRGGAATLDEIICYIDFGADKTSTGGNFTIQWNAEGILNLN